MRGRDIKLSSPQKHSLEAAVTTALLAAALFIIAPNAIAAPADGGSTKIILQHHPHRHAAGMGHGGQNSTHSKIILQHHAHGHAAGAGHGDGNSTKSKIILQHHHK